MPPSLDDENVASAIESSDIVVAIKKCNHGKASGPDVSGNIVYKEFSKELAPIMAN